jgi:acylphosphatase
MRICKKIRYSGHVQGVGFRYATRDLARGFAVAGYVRNLPKGEVELVAEGEAADVEGFLAAVEQQMAGYIQGRTEDEEVPSGYKDFVIRA